MQYCGGDDYYIVGEQRRYTGVRLRKPENCTYNLNVPLERLFDSLNTTPTDVALKVTQTPASPPDSTRQGRKSAKKPPARPLSGGH